MQRTKPSIIHLIKGKGRNHAGVCSPRRCFFCRLSHEVGRPPARRGTAQPLPLRTDLDKGCILKGGNSRRRTGAKMFFPNCTQKKSCVLAQRLFKILGLLHLIGCKFKEAGAEPGASKQWAVALGPSREWDRWSPLAELTNVSFTPYPRAGRGRTMGSRGLSHLNGLM